MNHCEAKTKSGSRCKKYSMRGSSPYCSVHNCVKQAVIRKEQRIVFLYIYKEIPHVCMSCDQYSTIELPNIGYLDTPLYELINMIGEKQPISNPSLCLTTLINSKIMEFFGNPGIFGIKPEMTIREFINLHDLNYFLRDDNFHNRFSMKIDNSNIIYIKAFNKSVGGYDTSRMYVTEGNPTKYNHIESTVKPSKRDYSSSLS